MDAVPMMSEWGATDNLAAIEIDAASADRHLMGWTHWAYKFWNDPTTADSDQGLFADDTDLSSVKQAKVRVLVRTYAAGGGRDAAGDAVRPGSGRFWFRYRPDRSVTAPTRIFVSPLHYPHGYRVAVRHGTYRRAGRYVLVTAELDEGRLGADPAALTLSESTGAAGTPEPRTCVEPDESVGLGSIGEPSRRRPPPRPPRRRPCRATTPSSVGREEFNRGGANMYGNQTYAGNGAPVRTADPSPVVRRHAGRHRLRARPTHDRPHDHRLGGPEDRDHPRRGHRRRRRRPGS